MKLYELTLEYERLQELAEEADDPEVVAEQLEVIEAKIEQKGAAIAAIIANLDAEADAYDREMTRLAVHKKRCTRNAERLRQYVLTNMSARGIRRLQAGTFAFTVRLGPERVVIDNERAIPPEFKREEHISEPNKRAILDAYKKTGECVAGTHVEQSEWLQIK